MRSKILRVFITLLTGIFILFSIGYTTQTVEAATKKVTKITLNKEKVTLYVKQSTTLKVTAVIPKNASKSVTWKSSNTKVATVNSKGKVTAKRAGSATITAYSKSNKKVKATCKVTVKNPTIKFSSKTITANVNQGVTLEPEVKGYSKTVKYYISSKDRKIATVSSKGYVKFKKTGTITVKATANGKSASVKVKGVKPTLTINKTSATIYTAGSTSVQLKAKTYGASKKITWSVSNKAYATVKDGKVVAKKAGKVNVYASANGLTVKCKIVIIQPVLKLNTTSVLLHTTNKKTQTVKVTKIVGPSNKVTWKSSNTKIATVNKGTITAVASGKTTVTASANGITTKVSVTVRATSEQVKPAKVKLGNDIGYSYTVGKDMKSAKFVSGVRTIGITPESIANRNVVLKQLSAYKTDLAAMFNNTAPKNKVYSIAGITIKVNESKTNYKKVTVSGKSESVDGIYEITVKKNTSSYRFTIKKIGGLTTKVDVTAALKNGMYTFNISVSGYKFIATVKVDGTATTIYSVTDKQKRIVASFTAANDSYVTVYNRTYLTEISPILSLMNISDDIIGFIDHGKVTAYY